MQGLLKQYLLVRILSLQALFIETFSIFTYILRKIRTRSRKVVTGNTGKQLSNNLFSHL